MEFKELIQKADFKEPLMVEWVLDQIQDKKQDKIDSDQKRVRMIEDELFNDISTRHMLNNFSPVLLTRIFQIISPIKFLNNIDVLIEKWPEWHDTAACWSAPLIARYNPGAAVELFSTYCRQGITQFGDLNKWTGILKSMSHLPDKETKDISAAIIKAYREASKDKTMKQMFSLYIVAMAWTYDHPDFDYFFKEHIMYLPTSRILQYSDMLTQLLNVFGFSLFEYRLICNIIDGYTGMFPENLESFYNSTIPIKVIEKAAKKLKKKAFDFVPSFFKDYGYLITDIKMRNTFKKLINDRDIIAALHKKKQRPYIYAMVLTCILASYRKQTIDLEELPVDRVVMLLATDIETIPDFDSFISYFKTRNKEDVILHLTGTLEKRAKYFGSSHILAAMGALGYDAFIGPLTDALSADFGSDFLSETAKTNLVKYGERAVDFFSDHFNELDDSGKMSALYIVRKNGGPKAALFINKYFDILWKLDKNSLLRACEAVCSEQCRKRLESKINKGQTSIDRTHLILTLLLDKKSTETDNLLQKYYKKQYEKDKITNAFTTGNLRDTIKSYVDVELRCKNCGDENIYRLKNIIVSEKRKGQPHIAEYIQCINCNCASELEFTSNGLTAVNAEIMRIMLFQSEQEKKEAYERSPINFSGASERGKSMDLHRKSGRNDPCPCGSGKKYKKCCLNKYRPR